MAFERTEKLLLDFQGVSIRMHSIAGTLLATEID
jgi:hypothetical protein